MARFGFLSLLLSLQALIGTGFAAVCSRLGFLFAPFQRQLFG